MERQRRHLGLGLALAAVILAADQATKWLMLERVFALPAPITLTSWHPPIVVTDFFNLVMVWNRGVSFGLFAGSSDAMRWVLLAVALAVSAGLLVWLARTPSRFVAISLALIIGGAIGNAIDRLRFGAVADFIDLHVAGWHWPAFNLADSGITVGVALLIADSLFAGDRHAPERPAPERPTPERPAPERSDDP